MCMISYTISLFARDVRGHGGQRVLGMGSHVEIVQSLMHAMNRLFNTHNV